ncbi:sortase domain-containing protein [Methanobrevibacter filiformis]|uniref:Sortase family protein n=1 Tax=Methanobrevibacter filiformis TaxID=55758 RepID=A0A166F1V8_9EURY|nr:sortase [Methanobrevibacter filiformis]KZX17236.1 sortase family protein [Methanobrevibacter filiformis]
MKISTVVVIIALVFISLYVVQEVAYFSEKIVIEKESNVTNPVLIASSIGLHEKINNVSLSQGVLIDELSNKPSKGEVILHGHRTLLGSPFLRLNEFKSGDIITIQWPDIGAVNYRVNGSKIVDPSYQMAVSNSTQKLYMITCDPIGSTAQRLIIESDMLNVSSLNTKELSNNPQEYYAIYIIVIFLAIGLIFTYFYPVKEDRIFILLTIALITGIMAYDYIFPFSPEIISSKLDIVTNFLDDGINQLFALF